MKKIGIITQARMSSTRLPGKIMLCVAGKPLLQYFSERLKESGVPLYIATTVNPCDDILVDFANEHAISYFRGSEEDVLKRFYECALEYKLDVIVRITSDCPLSDGSMVKDAVAAYLSFDNERIHYSNCVERTYPHGLNFEIFSFALLKEAHGRATTDFQREHVTPYMIQNPEHTVVLKHYVRDKDVSGYRLTVDTYQDVLLVRKLIEEHQAHTKSTEEIIGIFEDHPELARMNVLETPHVWANDGNADKQ